MIMLAFLILFCVKIIILWSTEFMRMFIFTNKIHSQVQIYVHIKLHINLPMKLLMKYKILCELKFMK